MHFVDQGGGALGMGIGGVVIIPLYSYKVRCGVVGLWGCGVVGLWGCGVVGLWGCGVVGLWGCGVVGLWGCGVVGLWGCGVVGLVELRVAGTRLGRHDGKREFSLLQPYRVCD